ncbi:MAG: zinc-ribbon domain-containing protein [Yoonia sp.]
MRLICPNCGAQYEVADDVIPEDGRDVQCSNCAHTWFEDRGASDEEDEFSEEVAAPSIELDGDKDDDDALWGAEVYAQKPAPAAKMPPKRQELDPSIADILREEAAREAAARRAEADSAIDDQADLGLDSVAPVQDQRSRETQVRMAKLKGEDPIAAVVAETVASSRRELLPDIEEINSSLRSDAERGTGYAEPEVFQAIQRRGFRTGFLSVLLILATLAALYIFAPQISAKAPAAAAPLNGYVTTVDKGRLWIDSKLRDFLKSLNAEDAAQAEAAAVVEPAPEVTTDAPAMPNVDQ